MSDEHEVDAYRYPQRVRPGCQHQLGCRCAPPYWLREPSATELAREAHMRRAFKEEADHG